MPTRGCTTSLGRSPCHPSRSPIIPRCRRAYGRCPRNRWWWPENKGCIFKKRVSNIKKKRKSKKKILDAQETSYDVSWVFFLLRVLSSPVVAVLMAVVAERWRMLENECVVSKEIVSNERNENKKRHTKKKAPHKGGSCRCRRSSKAQPCLSSSIVAVV
jgi:hypothetical protein